MPRLSPAAMARWKGQAHQVTTGTDSARQSHCQLSNCQEELICIATTGTPSSTATMSRAGVISARAV